MWRAGRASRPQKRTPPCRALSARCCAVRCSNTIASSERAASSRGSDRASSAADLIPVARTCMTGPVFVDTNILVYDRDERDASKHERAAAWMKVLWREPGLGVVSGQVLSEFYWTVTKKLRPGLSEALARRYLQALFAWEVVPVDDAAIAEAWAVQERFGFSFWDSLVVAAARLSRCRVLLTEDLQDGQDLDGLRVVSPFERVPEAVTLA